MILIEVNKLKATRTNCEPLTSGMIGAQIEVSFDSSWDGYVKTAVFGNGAISKDVIEAMWDGNIITIPAEVLATPYQTLSVGFYGFKLIDNVPETLPTVYAVVGVPMNGADPNSDPSTDPSLPVYAQLQWQIDHFEISEEQIAAAVQEYLEEHPVAIRPATANTLGGVKVGGGISVTSDGTLSADITDKNVSEAVNTALEAAKESGEFDGADGKSAYEIAVEQGYVGTEAEWLNSLRGTDGTDGTDGADGADGITPHIGANGNWYIGDTDTGNPSRGEAGQNGVDGEDGYTPVKGVDYFTDADKAEIAAAAAEEIDLSNYAQKDDLNDYQQTALTSTVTIAVADWEGGTTVTKNVTGVTATNIVFCDSSNADVQCTAQGTGTLTFTATTTPSEEVTVKVVILP